MAGRPNGNSRFAEAYEGSDGYWHGWVTVGTKPDGSLDRRHVMRKTKKSAQNGIRELERQRDAGLVKRPGRAPTVAEWMTTYLDTIAVHKLAPRSYDDYWSKTRRWIIPDIGNYRIDRLQPEHLDRLYSSMLRAGRAPSYVLKVHRVISRALKIAVRRQKTTRNVANLVDPPSVDLVEQDSLSRAEARAVLNEVRHWRNGARWSIGLACGLRQGEALGLRWEYVDLDTGDIRVWHQLQRNLWRHGCGDPHACGMRLHRPTCRPGCAKHARSCPHRTGGGLVIRRTKSKRRSVTLPAPLLAALREHRIQQRGDRVTAGELWSDHDLVFSKPNGRPIDPRRDWKEWGEILSAAGVRYVRPHDARHTAATLLIEQGVHVRTVQEILGHADLRTTQGYTHVSSEAARDAAVRIGAALWQD